MEEDLRLWPWCTKDRREDIKDVHRYTVERISCCLNLNRMGPKRTLGFAQEMLHSPKFYIKVDVRWWLKRLLVRYLRPCSQGLHFSLASKLHYWLAVKRLYINLSRVEHWQVWEDLHWTPRKHLGYTSAWPRNCLFSWMSKSCTSTCQRLNNGLPKGLWDLSRNSVKRTVFNRSEVFFIVRNKTEKLKY